MTKEKELKLTLKNKWELKKAFMRGFTEKEFNGLLNLVSEDSKMNAEIDSMKNFLCISLTANDYTEGLAYQKTLEEENLFLINGERIDVTNNSEGTRIFLHFKEFQVEIRLLEPVPVIDTVQKLLNAARRYRGVSDMRNVAMYFQEILKNPISLELAKENSNELILEKVGYENNLELAYVLFREYYEDNQTFKQVFYDEEGIKVEYDKYDMEPYKIIGKVNGDANFLDFAFTNTPVTSEWYKAFKSIHRNLIINFEMNKENEEEVISGTMKRRRLSNRAKRLLSQEEEKAFTLFNSQRISQ